MGARGIPVQDSYPEGVTARPAQEEEPSTDKPESEPKPEKSEPEKSEPEKSEPKSEPAKSEQHRRRPVASGYGATRT